ncbi:MAG: hypothetical protein JWN62_3233 [Acidimicrobiales bacterium]|nr:hypothetical protein [Acidimicrobiales bacterium]
MDRDDSEMSYRARHWVAGPSTTEQAPEAGSPRRARHRHSTGVTTRLVALVMLPVCAMGVLAGSVVVAHSSTAREAADIQNGVTVLDHVVALRDGLHSLKLAEAFEVRFAELDVTKEVATKFIGLDWQAQIAPARAEAQAAITALGEASPVTQTALNELTAAIDTQTISPEVALNRLGNLIEMTGADLTGRIDHLEAVASGTHLAAALESLRAAAEMVDAGTPQAVDLSALWFPAPTDSSALGSMARFGADNARYSTAADKLRELGVAAIVADLAKIERDPRVQAFDQAVADTLVGRPLTEVGAVVDNDKIGATFRGYLARAKLLDELVGTAIHEVRQRAQDLHSSERRGLVTWTLGSAVMALASIAIAVWLARSISKPLKDLAEYAHEVSEGQLDTEPPSNRHRGPRETQVAFRTFSHLVANLRLLDAKANALAQCHFDAPVLSEALPGRLGRSLESSVALLSGSIVERDQLQIRLAYQATHDSLTGLGNRPAAISAIEAAMRRAARTWATTALLFIDLNDFKAINDSHGHRVGDEVLRETAKRLTVELRSGDFAARLGGDEFVVVAENMDNVAEATDLAKRVLDAINRPIEFEGLSVRVGASVGVALTLDGPEEPLRLLARADAAMYRAKTHEGSSIQIFDADLQDEMIKREDIESALSSALAAVDGDGLQLHYQPVLDTKSGELVGVEALIRWDRPGHGLLAPDSFIPIAEATALIIDVDQWVLRQATRQLAAWSDDPALGQIPVAVNISGRHLLSDQLPGNIRSALDESGIDAHRLTIEITETVLLADLAVAAAKLDVVRAFGVKVAIDDFGTGYTSLAHLQQLPIDTLKIDRSFVSRLNVGRGMSLVRIVTDLGHAIELNVVAEGVETQEELVALKDIGADRVQGYLLSRPLTATALSTWARDRVADHRRPLPRLTRRDDDISPQLVMLTTGSGS